MLVSFSAGIVLLAALKCTSLKTKAGDAAFEACWMRCMTILEHYDDQIQSAGPARHALKMGRDRLTSAPQQDGTHSKLGIMPILRC